MNDKHPRTWTPFLVGLALSLCLGLGLAAGLAAGLSARPEPLPDFPGRFGRVEANVNVLLGGQQRLAEAVERLLNP